MAQETAAAAAAVVVDTELNSRCTVSKALTPTSLAMTQERGKPTRSIASSLFSFFLYFLFHFFLSQFSSGVS
jgi:hypothetical protein